MKLWLLKAREDLPEGDNPWEPWYDKNFGFVVRSETEEQARQLAHENDTKQPWLNSKYSQCTELLQDGEAEMIMQDFRAA